MISHSLTFQQLDVIVWRVISFKEKFVAIGMISVASVAAAPIPVKITDTGLQRAGVPYFIKGVGGDQDLTLFSQLGGNSVRTWSEDGLKELLSGFH